MSREIDERVVEMRFDNKQFKSATTETLGILDKLKEALKLPNLKNSLDGINNVAKNTKLDGIASAVEALEKRFSTLGIVGMRVIENLTDAVMNKLQTALSFVSDSIVSGGIRRAMNIENAHFQLQALLKDEEKVQAVMADAMESVDGTAYAYDEAAKAASQFAASGVQAGDDMLNALKGITGVAAMTNSSFEDISRVFTTVAGNGRLMGDQLLQLSSRGLNAASTIADYFKEVRGQANMTEAEVREMVSKGELDFKTFSDAMTWAFGDSAKRANETFTGAMSNMKSALARIGAEFVSPFIEQNSEMVKLFNALRIQINNVKSALTFNEQRSAIAGLTKESNLMLQTVSQFAKDGSMDFAKFTSAIIGTTKTEKELVEINKKLSDSYEKVREAGSASVETLVEFNQNGVDATNNLQKYINGVLDGTIKVSQETKESIQELTNGLRVSSSDIMQFAQDGKITFDIFTDAIVNASGAISNESKLASEAITNLLEKVKDSGAVTFETLKEFNKNGIDATKALLTYMNGVQDGSIRASYATTKAIEDITGGTRLLQYQVNNLAKEGAISYDIFQSALENMYGTEQALSKQFTDFVLDNVKKLRTYIESVDLTRPLEIFYYAIESGKNVLKGLYSVLKPIGQAFSEAFFNFDGTAVVALADKLETVTSKLKLSEKGSENLRKAFKGVFDVAKLLVDILVKLLRAFIPMSAPVDDLGDGLLGLAGSAGEALSKFTEWVRSSTRIKNVYNMLADVIKNFAKHVENAVGHVFDFIRWLSELPIVEKLLRAAENSFNDFLDNIGPFFDNLGDKILHFKDVLVDIIPEGVINTFKSFGKEISNMVEEFNNLEIDDLGDVLDFFVKKFKNFIDFVTSNDSLNSFVQNIKFFFEDLGEAFSLESVSEKIEKTLDLLERMVEYFQNIFGKMFEDFSLGSLVAGGSGIAIIVGIFKSLKSFESFSKTIGAIPAALGAIKDTLVSYQKNLEADAIWKIAKSIALLAGAILLLSFAEIDKVIIVGSGLVIGGNYLLKGINTMISALKKTKTLQDGIANLLTSIGKSFTKLSKAVNKLAIGSMFKSFAKTIAVIVLTIVGVGLMWQKNKEAIINGGIIVGMITTIVIGIMVGLSYLGETISKGMIAVSQASKGILKMALAVSVVVFAIKSLMNMDLPNSAQEIGLKMGIFAGAIIGVGALIVAAGYAGRIAMGMKLKTAPILAAAIGVYLIVQAMAGIMKLNIDPDWETKLDLIGFAIGGLGGLILALGFASKLADGALKGTGTILAMAAYIVIVTGALMLLATVNPVKLIGPTIALGVVLAALAGALFGAGKITEKTNWKSVMAMALNVGVILAALGILANVPLEDLSKATDALFKSLVGMAIALFAAGQISDQASFGSILAMAGAVLSIGVVLYALAEQPWDGILAASAGVSGTLLALAGTFYLISKSASGINSKVITEFFAVCLAAVPVGVTIAVLATFPWEGVLAAAVGLSGTMIALAACFNIIGKASVDYKKALTFVISSVALLPMAFAMSQIAGEPWEGIIAAAVGLSAAAVALAFALKIVGSAGINIVGCLGFVMAAIALIPIAIAVKELAEMPVGDAVKAVLTLAATLAILAVFTAVMSPLALGFIAVAAGLAAFGAAIAVVGWGLDSFVTSLLHAFDTFLKFFAELDPKMLYDVGYNVVMGFIEGLKGGFTALKDALFEFTDWILTPILKRLGIKSPSRVFAQIAEYCSEGFVVGLSNSKGLVEHSVGEVFGGIASLVDPNSLFSPGSKAAENFASGISSGKFDIKNIVSSIVSEANDEADTSEFIETGEEIVENIGYGMTSSGYDMNGMMEEVMGQMMNGFDMSQFQDLGGLGAESLFTGFTDVGSFGEFDFSSMIGNAFDSASSGADYSSLQLSGEKGGQEFVKSFSTTTKQTVPEAAEGVVNSLSRAINESIREANFTKQGTILVTEFLRAFKRSERAVRENVGVLMEYAITAISDKNEIFYRTGEESAENWINGVINRYQLAVEMGIGLADRVLEAIENKKTQFKTKGMETADHIIEGFRSRFQNAFDAADALAAQMLTALAYRLKDFRYNGNDAASQYISAFSENNGPSYNAGYDLSNQALIGLGVLKGQFYENGANAGQGFVDGLSSKWKSIKEAAAKIGQVASQTLRSALDEHSPSKVTHQIGEFFTEGFANGILKRLSLVDDAGSYVGEEAADAVQNSLTRLMKFFEDADISNEIVITPRIDTTYADEAINDISNMFANAVSQEANLTGNVAHSFGTMKKFTDQQYAEEENGKQMNDLLMKMTDLNNQPKVENTFYVTGNNPDEIAEKVSIILQKQYTRSKAAWE